MVVIEEIFGPAAQGTSRPFHCRGTDGNQYCVKGLPRSSQGAEWIAANVGQAFGLPIPDFKIVDIPSELLEEAPAGWDTLGSGPAFASCWQERVSWFEVANVADIDIALQQDILVFDWWIKNPDRTPYNTNLLWTAANKKLIVIDHNIAFDKTLALEGFIADHLFKDQWNQIDLLQRESYKDRFAKGFAALVDACANIPEEWAWQDSAQTVPSNFDLAYIQETIARWTSDSFWKEG